MEWYNVKYSWKLYPHPGNDRITTPGRTYDIPSTYNICDKYLYQIILPWTPRRFHFIGLIKSSHHSHNRHNKPSHVGHRCELPGD